jgi:hypothetical protein
MGNQINRHALPASRSGAETDICQGGNRPALAGRADATRLAVAGSWNAMAPDT